LVGTQRQYFWHARLLFSQLTAQHLEIRLLEAALQNHTWLTACLPDTWLTAFLLRHTMPHELIRHCHNILVTREGFKSADGLARAGKITFTPAYLNSVRVYGVCLHMLLHNLCANLINAYSREFKTVRNMQVAARAAVRRVQSRDGTSDDAILPVFSQSQLLIPVCR